MGRPQNWQGRQLGQWHIGEQIGAGGNASVWIATREHRDTPHAIKILNQRNKLSEPYARFSREIVKQQNLNRDQVAGILPIVDSNIPESPSRDSPAWHVTPLAETAKSVFSGENPPLYDVLFAIRDIAVILASLHLRGYSHRDIKPENIYWYADGWALGDFGLLGLPEDDQADRLTADAKKLGSQHYLAPEMLVSPERADGIKADIYSLGKTMWVLSTGQTYPLPGPHRIQDDPMRISAIVAAPRIRFVDVLLDRMTALAAETRPSADEVANELTYWLQPRTDVQGASSDGKLSDVSARLAAMAYPHRQAEVEKSERNSDVGVYVEALNTGLESIAQLAAQFGIESAGIEHGPILRLLIYGSDAGEFGEAEFSVIHVFKTEIPISSVAHAFQMWSGFVLEYRRDRRTRIAVGHALIAHSRQTLYWSEREESVLGSAHLEQLCEQLIGRLKESYADCLETAVAEAEVIQSHE